jgi:hypothetical protein
VHDHHVNIHPDGGVVILWKRRWLNFVGPNSARRNHQEKKQSSLDGG